MTMKWIIGIALYIAFMWFVCRFLGFCDDREDE